MFFFLPIGSTRPRWRTPYVTYALLIANLMVSLLVWNSPNPAGVLFKPSSPSVESWILSLFAHGNVGHYLGNALFLWLFGSIAEDVLGPGLFVLFYLGGNIGASALDYYITATYVPLAISVPWLGASGAIAGILGLAACCFMRAKVRVAYLVVFPRFSAGVANVPMPVFGALWLAWEVFQGLVMTSLAAETGRYGGVAHWAHVGGFAVGVAGALALKLPGRISRSDLVSSHDAPGNEYDAYREAGELEHLLAESPEDALAWRAYGQALELSGRESQAREAYAKAVALSLKQGSIENAAEAYQEACAVEPLNEASAETLLQLGFALQSKAKPAEAYQVLRHLARVHPNSRQVDTALARAGEIARVALHRPEAARECYQELLDSCPASPMRGLCQEKLKELTAPISV